MRHQTKTTVPRSSENKEDKRQEACWTRVTEREEVPSKINESKKHLKRMNTSQDQKQRENSESFQDMGQ